MGVDKDARFVRASPNPCVASGESLLRVPGNGKLDKIRQLETGELRSGEIGQLCLRPCLVWL